MYPPLPPPSNTNNTNICAWLQSLPPLNQWKHPSLISNNLSSSLLLSLSQPSPPSTALCLTITTENLTLWTSKPLQELGPTLSLQSLQTLFLNLLHDFLNYNPLNPSSTFTTNDIDNYSFLFDNLPCTINATTSTNNNHDQDHPTKTTTESIPPKQGLGGQDYQDGSSSLEQAFNLALNSLSFLACTYKKAPFELRSPCLLYLKGQLTSRCSHEASWQLMRAMGSTLEGRWMRSLNLAITTLEAELDVVMIKAKADKGGDGDGIIGLLRTRCPSALFSKAMSKGGMWKVQVYCPLSAMEVENSNGTADDKLMYSLNHHQLEVVVQLNYQVDVKDKWVDLLVYVDNIRLNVVALVSELELKKKGEGSTEKHFPSRISLQLTPSPPSADVLSVSVSKSSDNPTQEINHDRTIQGSLDSTSMPGLHVSASNSSTTTLKPWKFEESALQGDSGSLCWFLHDSATGSEIFASKPSVIKQLFQPRAWFKNRYSSATRPFTRQGGVVFAKDEYGDQAVAWKVDKAAVGKSMGWEVKGSVGLTYWPNKCRTLYNDTRRARFNDTLHLSLN